MSDAEKVLALLRGNVRDELAALNASLDLRLPATVLDTIADSVTANIDYAFRVQWEPRWLKPGEAHVWSEGDSSFAMCTVCLDESPRLPSRVDAQRWSEQHRLAMHP